MYARDPKIHWLLERRIRAASARQAGIARNGGFADVQVASLHSPAGVLFVSSIHRLRTSWESDYLQLP